MSAAEAEQKGCKSLLLQNYLELWSSFTVAKMEVREKSAAQPCPFNREQAQRKEHDASEVGVKCPNEEQVEKNAIKLRGLEEACTHSKGRFRLDETNELRRKIDTQKRFCQVLHNAIYWFDEWYYK